MGAHVWVCYINFSLDTFESGIAMNVVQLLWQVTEGEENNLYGMVMT